MAGPRLCEESLLTHQEGLKRCSDPDVSNALAPARIRYWSKPVNVIQISSSLIMNPPPPPYWVLLGNVAKPWRGTAVYRSDLAAKASSRLQSKGNLCQVSPARMEMWNVLFTGHSVNCWPHVNTGHTQNMYQMLTYTYFKWEKHGEACTSTQSCHWYFLQVKAGIKPASVSAVHQGVISPCLHLCVHSLPCPTQSSNTWWNTAL